MVNDLSLIKGSIPSVEYSCPVCGGSKASNLWTVTSSEAAQHFILREKNQARNRKLALHVEHLWKRDMCSVVRCERCDFCYAFPYVAGDGIFYDLAYDHNSYPGWKWEFQVTLDILKKQVRPEYRLLEIGSGDGAFVRRLLSTGFSREAIVCTEYSVHGRGKIEALGIHCLNEDIRTVSRDQFSEPFDSICLFQVLEHLDRLDDLFRTLHDLLASDGSLFLAVPNSRRIEFNESHGALLDMPPNHVGRWNRQCFEQMAKGSGFRLEAYATEPFGFFPAWKQLAYYRFLRSAQRSGSLANRIHRISHRRLRKFMEIGAVALTAAWSFPTAITMTPDMGNSQWAHFIRVEA